MLRRIVFFFAILLVAIFASSTAAFCDAANLVKNPGFEEVKNGQAVGWTYKLDDAAKVSIADDAYSGTKSIHIKNSAPVDSMVRQDLKVSKGKLYKVSAWVKANIKNQRGSANITLYYVDNNTASKGIYTSKELMDTAGDWEKIEFSIKTNKDTNDPLTIAVRLGGQGTPNEGEVYFDNVEFIEITERDKLATHFEFKTMIAEKKQDPNADKGRITDKKGPTLETENRMSYFWLVLILVSIVILFNRKGTLFNRKLGDEENKSDDKLEYNKGKKDANTQKEVIESFFDDDED